MFSRILWRKSPRCPETRLASHDDERAVVHQPLPGRAGTLFKRHAIVSRLPDKRLRSHTRGQCYRRTRQRAAARPALCGNLHVHLEVCSGIPAAGGVMHTLNLRLSAEELGWIAADGQDRFLIVDDILLPLVRQMAPLHAFEKVLVFRFSGAALGDDAAGLIDYDEFIAGGDADNFSPLPHAEDDPIAICYTSGTTSRPKCVAYSHRSTVLLSTEFHQAIAVDGAQMGGDGLHGCGF